MARITIADLARQLAVSPSTVSRALRNDPRLRPETIKRIQAAAQEAGYRWDPRVSRAMSGMLRRGDASGTSLAVIHAKPGAYFRDGPAAHYWQVAREISGEKGLGIEIFSLLDFAGGGRRLSQVLTTRAIRGVLLFPFHEEDITGWNLDWAQFALVAVGSCPRTPPIMRVDTDDFALGANCTRRLLQQDCRRIGFVSDLLTANHTDWKCEAGYWSVCVRSGLPVLPIIHLPEKKPELSAQTRDCLQNWFSDNQPDAVVTTSHAGAARFLREIAPALRFAFLTDTPMDFPGSTGAHYTARALVEPALDHLLDKMFRNAFGLDTGNPSQTLQITSTTWEKGA